MHTRAAIRLAFGAVYVRAFLLSFLLVELAVWNKVRKMFPGAWKPRRFGVMLYFTPGMIVRSVVIAAAITCALDLLVRLVGRPLIERWYRPLQTGAGNTPIGFHLQPGETILGETPGRIRSGRGWRAGTLIRTSRVTWFFPSRWELEPWSLPVESLRVARLRDYRPLLGSFVTGVPARLVLQGLDGSATEFAVDDPEAVRDWFGPVDLRQSLPRAASLG